jgi:hypothetical protein
MKKKVMTMMMIRRSGLGCVSLIQLNDTGKKKLTDGEGTQEKNCKGSDAAWVCDCLPNKKEPGPFCEEKKIEQAHSLG